MNFEVIQLIEKETSTYTYLVFDGQTKQAAIIDPVDVCFPRDSELIKNLGLELKYSLETHIHADHITSAGKMRAEFSCLLGVSSQSGSTCADINIDGGEVLALGEGEIKCFATPGHTRTCVSFYTGAHVFTGDALLINGCGRTDFQEGSAKDLFKSVREILFALPEGTKVFPGHDYNGFTSSTVGFQKRHNSRLKLDHSFEDFKNIMRGLKLAPPKKINEAVPANLKCGQI